jgi:hypothetical protein
MIVTITINVPDQIDLDHALESISDATFVSDNVTAKEQDFVLELIQRLKKKVENEARD